MGLDANSILRHHRVSLDTNIFIYALNDNPKFPFATTLLKLIPASSLIVTTSVVSVLETSVHYYKHGQSQLLPTLFVFISCRGRVAVIEVNQDIALIAGQLRASYRLKTADAIQLGTALYSKSELFITADRDFKLSHVGKTQIVVI